MKAPKNPTPNHASQGIKTSWFYRWLIRPVGWLAFACTALLLLCLIALHLPFVQTYLAKEASHYLSEQLNHKIELGYLSIEWLDEAVVENARLYDIEQRQMIHLDYLAADFNLIHVLQNSSSLSFDGVDLVGVDVRLVTAKGDTTLNIQHFVESIKALSASDTSQGGSFELRVNNVRLDECRFRYADYNRDSIPEGFNYNQFTLDGIGGRVDYFYLDSTGGILVEAEGLHTQDVHSGLTMHDYTGGFVYSDTAMLFTNLDVAIGNSYLSNFLAMRYDNMDAMGDFVHQVRLEADLDSTHIATSDIAYFAPTMGGYRDRYFVHGHFLGTLNNLRTKDATIHFGKQSKLRGEYRLKGLPEMESTFMDYRIRSARVAFEDAATYIPNSDQLDIARRFGLVQLEGQFTGFYNDFAVNVEVQGKHGFVGTDLRLNLKENVPKYSGKVLTRALDVGYLTNNELFGLLDMKGKVEQGQGFELATANAHFDGSISRLGFNGYNYQSMDLVGEIAKKRFHGNLSVADSNCLLNLDGQIDFEQDLPTLNFQTQLEHVDLYKLHFTGKPSQVSTEATIRLKGLQLENTEGDVHFRNLDFQYDSLPLQASDIYLESKIDLDYRHLSLRSPFANLEINGNYTFQQVNHQFSEWIQELKLLYFNDSAQIADYYEAKAQHEHPTFDMEVDLLAKNINPLLHFLDTSIHISRNEQLQAYVAGGPTVISQIGFSMDSLLYGGSYLGDVELDLVASKNSLDKDFVASAYFYSQKQDFKGFPPTDSMIFRADWHNYEISSNTAIQMQDSPDQLGLSLGLFFRDSVYLNIDSSDIVLLGEQWKVNRGNRVNFYKDSIFIHQLRLFNEQEFFEADGLISRSPEDSLLLRLGNFNLNNLNYILNQRIGGLADAEVKLKDLYNKRLVTGDLMVDAFSFEDMNLGDIEGSAHLDTSFNQINLRAYLMKKVGQTNVGTGVEVLKDTVFLTQGAYKFNQEKDNLDLEVLLNETNLRVAEPFMEDLATDIQGFASGKLHVGGEPSNPAIRGYLYADQGQIRLDYTNCLYRFSDSLFFEPQGLVFHDFRLLDEDGSEAHLTTGGLLHDNWSDFRVDLEGNMEDFHVLNTTREDNDLFYGTAYATGTLTIKGPLDDLKMEANMRNERNTTINIPMDSKEEEVAVREFIEFTSFTDTAKFAEGDTKDHEPKDSIGRVEISGIAFDFNLQLNPKAQMRILFDEEAGDILNARGSGNLKLSIDTRGDFNIFGRYRIEKGDYTFTFRNIIKKEFQIKPGGFITWSGDPLNGRIDLTAEYRQNVLMANWARTAEEELPPEYRRRYPVVVDMNMQGALLNPEIIFGVDVIESELPQTMRNDIRVAETYLETDEQEKNRQVFSLLLLGSVQPIGDQSSLSGGGANYSELLSNEISNMLSQYDENVDVNINLGDFSANTFQLGLSYYLFDRRLRISREGGFTNAGTNNSDLASIAGDWTVEYILTEDGALRMKMFHRNTQTIMAPNSNLIDQNTTQQGVSVMHTQSFNSLSELFSFLRRKKKPEALNEGTKETQRPDEFPKEDSRNPTGNDQNREGQPDKTREDPNQEGIRREEEEQKDTTP